MIYATISGAGDWNLFCTLEAALVAAIPQDCSEWRRSYGRIFKKVFVDATFKQFSKDILPNENDWNLIKQPIFHIYWTDCAVSSTWLY
jgi:trafficking protein particle complex subunit 10